MMMSLKQKKMIIKPRIKLNQNTYYILDLLQVDLTSFLASIASSLGYEAAERETRRREVNLFRLTIFPMERSRFNMLNYL